MEVKNKYEVGDTVKALGMEGTISELKFAGYLVDFPNYPKVFIYESDLTKVEDTNTN